MIRGNVSSSKQLVDRCRKKVGENSCRF